MIHSFDNGKYTLIYDNGNITALRYGEPWNRDCTGDKLIFDMLCEIDELKSQLSSLKKLNHV